ncbi:Lrp/AsnC family transcriptional regulator [Brevibacillus invocatus]|uniref:Lrp/AsnC family transcriptional regulator n=1 Tax=Brevibacillus invocatus TaxID=173959 RepID=A0A3M8C1H8_9BACL|nr:Lrp/AsnC family transcriptional regulator [Brevibacillus invocatus]MCM3081172.1 Lrp/AsnC family transcriptional regulator [Brevibacillus invocatus]MCM3431463.1 Lrp/AsnC family transcriptional regulator [Brevibacillus invocatus]RNB69413.1 Lrp/AsnC family transcriptional regulator [Brevibacillus invocatus]
MDRQKQMELLRLLEEDSRQDAEQLGKMLAEPKEEIEKAIAALEDEKIIVKYPALINWERMDDHPYVNAMIDVKVTPKRDVGFDEVAERICRFPEVKAVYLMSGASYDLSVVLEGKTMREVASFVSQKLATLDSVISTATHFILKRYKHDGIELEDRDEDRRMVVTP